MLTKKMPGVRRNFPFRPAAGMCIGPAMLLRSLTAAALFALPFTVTAAPESPGRISEWHGGERHDFKCGERAAILVCPRTPAEGRPWIWRTEFFGHEPQADAALLAQGWHVAYLDVQNLYGSPTALEAMDAFFRRMTAGRGLAGKVVLEGFSRGGLFALNWAARNPGKVSSIYNDAPVCDFSTWPANKSPADWERLLKCYGITAEQAPGSPLNPVNNLAPLAKAGIPLLHVVGDADDVVPVAKNTAVVEERYKALGGKIEVIHKPGVNHHPHSLVDPKPIVDFVLANFKPQKNEVGSLAQPAKIDPALPNVLLIGDSISIGYTADTRRLLEGKANVFRVPVNGGPTTNGIEFLDDWLSERRWAVIHFNWGLHDLKHVAEKPGQIVDTKAPGAHHQVAVEDYEKNLTALTTRLKATGAALLWAETTPVPAGANGRIPGDELTYNTAAARVMQAAGIKTNPLYARAQEKPELQKPKDVHFTPAGSTHLAEKVAAAINQELTAK